MKDYAKKHIDFIKPKSQIQCIVAARAINEARIAAMLPGRTREDIDYELRKLEIALYKRAENLQRHARQKKL
jgi:hypothetical protein